MPKITEAAIAQATFWGELICLDCGAAQEIDEDLDREVQHCEICTSPYLLDAKLVEKVRLAIQED